MSQSAQPSYADTECIIAAILTIAACGTAGTYTDDVIKRYAQLLDHLRAVGGYSNPAPPP
jgi:hypothetical protein